MKQLEELIKLQDVKIEIWSNELYKVGISYANCEVKNGAFLVGAYGKGETIEEAVKDYISQISGKTLVFNACSPNRREVTVLL